MKIIDDKGKLFGLINIIDLSVLLIVLLLAGAVGYKVLGDRGAGIGATNQEVTIEVACRLVSEESAKALKPGDQLVAGSSYANGVIESVTYQDGDYSVPTDDGRLVLAKHPLWKDVFVTIKATTDTSGAIIKIGGQEVRIGNDYIVKTKNVEIEGEVTAINFR